jgi:hypothetical protein
MKTDRHPLRVYLDSSDFSVMSDLGRCGDEHASTLRQLRRWVADSTIICLFSGTHLSEMAPVDANFADAAERRANILVDLCGRNALISLDVLFTGELQFALGSRDALPVAYSSSGEWYPEGVAEVSPVGAVQLTANVKEVIRELLTNRSDRRRAERKFLKKGMPREQLQVSAVANARTGSLDEILEKYPMRPADARILSRYAVGDASPAEATAAFLESLRDPRWMMKWFYTHHQKLSPFIQWVRKPAVAMLASLSEMAAHAAEVRSNDARSGMTLADTLLSPSKWGHFQDELLVRVASRLAAEFSDQGSDSLTTDLIDSKCPGLSVCIRSLHSAWWTSTSKTPRQAKLSDFPDALHAMYAPYVDVFRADSFMAPYIDKCSKKFGTQVVPKLSALLPAIQMTIEARQNAA